MSSTLRGSSGMMGDAAVAGGSGSSNNSGGGGGGGGINGMTIKEILEKVDLFNIAVDDDEDPLKGEKVLVGKPKHDGKTVVSASDPESAFLGPKLWDKAISMPVLDTVDTEFAIMNIDEFLNENNISLDDADEMATANSNDSNDSGQHEGGSKESTPEPRLGQHHDHPGMYPHHRGGSGFQLPAPYHHLYHYQQQQQQLQQQQQQQMHSPDDEGHRPPPREPKTSNPNHLKRRHSSTTTSAAAAAASTLEPPAAPNPSTVSPTGKLITNNILPKDSNTDFLYAESKRARLERERQERRRRQAEEAAERERQQRLMEEEEEEPGEELAPNVEFAPEDLALATVPGASFDPRRRAFTEDELKPQPIIRKRRKHYVPSENKDDRYWEKRQKNNMAARRSREARRLKENQIALRAAFLEKENGVLRRELAMARADAAAAARERDDLADRLARLEKASL